MSQETPPVFLDQPRLDTQTWLRKYHTASVEVKEIPGIESKMKSDSCNNVASCKLDKNRGEVYFVLFKEALS